MADRLDHMSFMFKHVITAVTYVKLEASELYTVVVNKWLINITPSILNT